MADEIEVVTSWAEFREKWAGDEKRHNFLLRGEMFPFQFDSPPLQAIMEALLGNEQARILRAGNNRKFKPTPYPQFRELPIEQAIDERVLLGHFEMRHFAASGQVFEGLGEIFDGWYRGLSQHGFTWNEQSAQRAIFWSGPHCPTSYHFDSSYVLAWQIAGRKRFCWLKEPEKWCSKQTRREDADHYDRMAYPEGITSDDVIECEMWPGDVLWNVMLTPHWVYSLDETTYSFNLTHFDLACDGELSPIGNEYQQILQERQS